MSLNIVRVGEPRFLTGPSAAYESPSLKMQKDYEVETTPLPEWPRGKNWCDYFNDQLRGDPFLAERNGGNKITVQCHPDKCPDWLGRVDAAITKTNEYCGTIEYPDNV